MRIIYITRGYTVHDKRWLNIFESQKFIIGYISLKKIDFTNFNKKHSNIILLESPELENTLNTNNLNSVLEKVIYQWNKFKPDIAIAGPITDAGYLAAKINAKRTLLMAWGFDILLECKQSTDNYNRILTALSSGASLLTDCNYVAEQCKKINGGLSGNLCIMPWGLIKDEIPEKKLHIKIRNKNQPIIVLAVRGFEEIHQPFVLLDAFAKARSEIPNLYLWLAGNGSIESEVKEYAKKTGFSNSIKFLGYLDQHELAMCYSQADLYISCTVIDGSSISLLQAMSVGLPCIVYDIPSNYEWLSSIGGKYANNSLNFSKHIISIANLDSKELKLISEHNRKCVEKKANLFLNMNLFLDTLYLIKKNIQ